MRLKVCDGCDGKVDIITPPGDHRIAPQNGVTVVLKIIKKKLTHFRKAVLVAHHLSIYEAVFHAGCISTGPLFFALGPENRAAVRASFPQKVVFPEVEDPQPIYYQFDGALDSIFNQTLDLIINEFKYSRYVPMLYLKQGISHPIALSQTNMRKFLKILLLKRLESSFYAFKKTIKRFISSYQMFIEQYENGRVFVSKKYTNKIFELLENHQHDENVLIAYISAVLSLSVPVDFYSRLLGRTGVFRDGKDQKERSEAQIWRDQMKRMADYLLEVYKTKAREQTHFMTS